MDRLWLKYIYSRLPYEHTLHPSPISISSCVWCLWFSQISPISSLLSVEESFLKNCFLSNQLNNYEKYEITTTTHSLHTYWFFTRISRDDFRQLDECAVLCTLDWQSKQIVEQNLHRIGRSLTNRIINFSIAIRRIQNKERTNEKEERKICFAMSQREKNKNKPRETKQWAYAIDCGSNSCVL